MAEKPEDLSLPASVIARIIKDALPEGVSVSKEARVAISKAASVFILYCTACSNNLALQAKRKTLAAGDVISALSDMEFDEFVPELKTFLEAYRKDQKGKRVAAADKRKQKAVAAAAAVQQSPMIDGLPTDQAATSSVSQAAGGGGGEGGEGDGGGGRGEEGDEQEEPMETDNAPLSTVVSSQPSTGVTT